MAKQPTMRRVIVDYKRLDHQIASLLIDLYPHGYGDDDIIVLKKPNGDIVEAVEVRTDDTIYLVKISKSLSNFIANFEENLEKELDNIPKSHEAGNEVIDADLNAEPNVDLGDSH